MNSSSRWTWCFFGLLALAAGFPLFPLPRFVILHASLGSLYLPLKILFLNLVLLAGGLGACFLVYGRVSNGSQRTPGGKSPAPHAHAGQPSPLANCK